MANAVTTIASNKKTLVNNKLHFQNAYFGAHNIPSTSAVVPNFLFFSLVLHSKR